MPGSELLIIYEDQEILVVHKPSGLPSVPIAGDDKPTLLGLALERVPGARAAHRLDTGTSGLLVLAKTETEYERLRGLWRQARVKKTYRALCRPGHSARRLEPLPLLIDSPLAHHAKSAKRMIVLRPTDRHFRGKPLEALSRVTAARGAPPPLHDLEIEIETGVMHQIRCHLASIGWPIDGDPIYGGAESTRLWLHAWRLSFALASGVELSLQSMLPDGWPSG